MRLEHDFSDQVRRLVGDVQFRPPRGCNLVVLGGLVFLLVVAANSFVIVGAGERAAVFSKLSGVKHYQLGEGLHLNLPLVWVPTKYDVKTQTYTMSAHPKEGLVQGDDSLSALTSDGLPVRLDVSVRFHVMPDKVWKLHQQIGRDYVDKVVRPVSRSDVRMVFARFTVTEVYSGERRRIIEEIRDRLEQKFAANYLQLDEVLLRDVQFSEQFQHAIEQKQVAQQQAKRMVFVLQQAELERQRKIVEAEGEAGAISLRAQALKRNPQLIQYEYVKGLPPDVKTVVADAKTILNFSDLFQQPQQ